MATNLLRLVHAAIIIRILLHIAHQEVCHPGLAAAEIGLTLVRSTAEKRLMSNRTRYQILLSLLLGYSLFPNKIRSLSWLFFFKTIEVHQNLKAVRKSNKLLNNTKQPFIYIAFFFDIIRFSLNQFMFMGIISIIYRLFCDSIDAPIPDPYIVIYLLIVTASTIGYGDFTPKTKIQILYFTCVIPFLCASFCIYINSLTDVYTRTFLSQQNEQQKSVKVTN